MGLRADRAVGKESLRISDADAGADTDPDTGSALP